MCSMIRVLFLRRVNVLPTLRVKYRILNAMYEDDTRAVRTGAQIPKKCHAGTAEKSHICVL